MTVRVRVTVRVRDRDRVRVRVRVRDRVRHIMTTCDVEKRGIWPNNTIYRRNVGLRL